MMPSEIQRRAPFTPLPTWGINTAISNTIDATNNQGAIFSQVDNGIWNAISAATAATTSDTAWRVRKWVWA